MTDFRSRRDELNALQREFAEEDSRQNTADYKEILQIPAFRRVLISILKKAHVSSTISYNEGNDNILQQRVGFRELGVAILFDAKKADADLVRLAEKEREEIEKKRNDRMDALLEKINETKGNER